MDSTIVDTPATPGRDPSPNAPARDSSRCPRLRLSLRLFIAGLAALSILIAGATTLAITYSLARASLVDIGKKYAEALAAAASIKAGDYFERPVMHLRSIQTATLAIGAGATLPSDNPALDGGNLPPFAHVLIAIQSMTNLSYPTVGAYFDDGSVIGISRNDARTALANYVVNTWHHKQDPTFPYGNATEEWYTYPAMEVLPREENIIHRNGIPWTYNTTSDMRPPGWTTIVNLCTADGGTPMWFSTLAYSSVGQTPTLIVLIFAPIYNTSGSFLGLAATAMPFTDLDTFLRTELQMTKNAAAFLFDGTEAVLGTSLVNVVSQTRRTVPANYTATAAGCYTLNTLTANIAVNAELCLTQAVDVPFAPLQAVRGDTAFMRGTVGGVRAVRASGDTWYVVAPAIANTGRNFAVTAMIFVPQKDLLGDLDTGRNVTIGICAAILVVVTLLAAIGVAVVLRPLDRIAQRMFRVSQLQIDVAAVEASSKFHEIRALQHAYDDMQKAVDSFTRYVPRDVVKDLMQTGQLCAIGMEVASCTMLFADIVGFTSLCERVPADRLGRLITGFFDTSSALVMEHGGLVDKFIGDCVMAVWGAPFACANMQAKAALCALRMSHSTFVEPLAGIFDREGELLALRVGVNTGEVLAGNMGSAQRMSYTVIGDAVNLAARLEGLNKTFGTRVLLSEFVVNHHRGDGDELQLRSPPLSENSATLVSKRNSLFAHASAATNSDPFAVAFALRLLGRIQVVGKEEPVRVYEAVGLTCGWRRPQPAEYELLHCRNLRRVAQPRVSGCHPWTRRH
jgi:class 3 adenylate cyclase